SRRRHTRFSRDWSSDVCSSDLEPYELAGNERWMQFVREGLPQLREAGWQIRILPDFHFNLAEITGWYARLDEAEDRQWFDLEMGIEVEGQRISLLPILLQAIRTRPWLLSGEAQDSEDDVLFGLLPSGQR